MTSTQLTFFQIDKPQPVLRATCARHGWDAQCGLCADWERWRMARAQVWYGYISADSKHVITFSGARLARITQTSLSRPRWSAQGRYKMRYIQCTATDGTLWYGRGSANQDLVTLRRVIRNPAPPDAEGKRHDRRREAALRMHSQGCS